MHIEKPLLRRKIIVTELDPSTDVFIISICLVIMNVFARFDEIPSMTLQDIKETKPYGQTERQMIFTPQT